MPHSPSANGPRRHIDLEAVHNFRDLGGYPARDGRETVWRRIFRADGLYRLTSADVDALRPLGLRMVIDLRTAGELSERGTFPLDLYATEFYNVSVLDQTWDEDEARSWGDRQAEFLLEKYRHMLRTGADRFAEVFTLIADEENAPVVFHCAAGKDRTGLVAGLLLAALGVDDEVIAYDFALSVEAGQRTREWAHGKSPELSERFALMPAVFHAAHPESILGVLDDLRSSHGSVRNYLISLGVGAKQWESLEQHFLTT